MLISHLQVIAVRGGFVVGSLAYALVITRYSGAEEAGLFFISVSVMAAGVLLIRGGLQEPLVRIVSIAYAEHEYGWIRSANNRVAVLCLFAGGGLTLVIYFLHGYLATYLFDEAALALPILIAATSIPPLSYIWLVSSFFKSMNRPTVALMFDYNGVALASLPFVLAASRYTELSAAIALIIFSGSSYLVAIIGLSYFYAKCPSKGGSKGSFKWREVSSSIAPMLLTSVTSYLLASSPVVFIGAAVGARAAGLFAISLKLARSLVVINSIINAIYCPRFARLHAQRSYREFWLEIRRAGGAAIALSFIPFVLISLFPGFALSVFGPEATEGRTILLVLAVGTFLEVAIGPAGSALLMMGKEHLVRSIMLITAGTYLVAVAVWWKQPNLIGFSFIVVGCSGVVKLIAAACIFVLIKQNGSGYEDRA